MTRTMIALGGAAAALALGAGVALAADHEAGVPLSPQEAAGGWTLETEGHSVCMIRLTADHAARPDERCSGMLPDGVTNWVATSDGMALTGADGQQLVPFDRWSNSLFVARRSSGLDVQLMRGGPHPTPGVTDAGLLPGPRPYD
jgi:hypothetical protein